MRLVALYYVLLRPDLRRKGEFYLRRRFPEARGFSLLRHGFRLNVSLGKSLIDRALVGILGPSSTRVSLEGQEELLALLEEGKGLILVTAHVGCWQAALSALAFLKTPVHLLMQREEGDIDRHYHEHRGEVAPFRIIDPRGEFGGALEMLGVLKRGEILSVMGDRVLGAERNAVSVDFLGAPVRLPVSAYKLASATGAPVGVLLSAKTADDRYQLRLARVIRVPAALSRKPGALAPYVRQVAETLEEYTRSHPYQFFNFFDMWDPESGIAAAAAPQRNEE